MHTRAKRILVIEDDKGFKPRLRNIVKDNGYVVVGEIAQGRQAVELIQALQPDVVLIGQQLRDMDGITAARQISARCPVPIVLVVASETPEWTIAAREAGVGYCLLKPVTPRQLTRAIDVALARLNDMRELCRLNAALRASEQRHTLAQRAANMGSWEWDVPAGELRWSERVEPVFGLAPGAFAGTYAAFLQCVYPEDRQRVESAFDACVQKGADCEEYEIEHRIVWPDGSVRWVAEMGNVIRNARGEALRIVGVVQDVTAQKQAEVHRRQAIVDAQRRQAEVAALLESSRAILQYRGFGDAARAIFDACKQLIGATSGYVALLTPDGAENEVLFLDAGGLPCTVDPLLPMPIRGLRSEAYHTRAPVYDNDFHSSEWMKFMPQGHVRLDNVLFAPLILRDQAIGLLGLANKPEGFTDHDAHMAAAFGELAAIALRNSRTLDALHESEKRYRLLAENASDYIVRVSRDGTLLFVPESSRRFMGYDPDQVIDTKIYAHTHPDDREKVIALLDSLLKDEQEARVEYRTQLWDGRYKWVEATGRLIYDQATGEPEIIAVARDIAERKQIEEERERYASELRRSNEELQQFAYVISHDMREPLRMIKGYMDLLAQRYRDQLDSKAREYIDYAVDGAVRMQEMIQALLRLSRIKTHGLGFAPTDVEAVLARAQQALGRAIQERGAVVTHDALPTVMADEAQLAQVLQNLIANAIKFCREDTSPHVHVSARQADDEWVFSVADNGIGIDPGQGERIFQIFQRLHTREEYEGAGIGLALCQRIVERHGGRIWVESEPGAGSTFYFTLP